MNTMTTELFCRIRSPRLQAASTILLLLLQRTPVLKFLVEAETGAALGVPQILRSAVVVAATLGAVDSVSGATTFVSNPSTPVNATTNQQFGLVFSITGSASSGGGAHSWTIYGPLPPGLAIPGAVAGPNNTFLLNTGTGSITGTPTQAGTWDVTFKAWEKANQSGEAWNVQKLGPLPVVRITVSGSGALVFTSQPMSASVAVGGTFNVGVTTSGTPAPTLQWRKDGNPIQGATNEIYSIGSVSLADAGSYTVVATNSGGSITSDAAILTVTAPATITTQPSSQQVALGSTASFSVTATGTPAPTYQWRKNGVSISGKTQSTLTIDPVTSGDVGTYTVRVQNSTATVNSSAAELTLLGTAPAITTQPSAQQVAVGGSATFSVVATGDPAPTYQWRKDGQAITGKTGSSLTINPVSAGDVGSYTVRVQNVSGTVDSNAAELTLLATGTAPAITTQPSAQQVAVGGSATFSVVATGDPAPTFQWRKDGQAISGATASTYSINQVAAEDAGAYSVVVTNDTGSVTSNVVDLTVETVAGPEILHQPIAQVIVPGGGATFRVDAGSGPGLTYQWRKDGLDLSGATGSTLNLSNVQAGDAGTYTVSVTSGGVATESAGAVLSINAGGFSRLSNLSTRTRIAAGGKVIPGFAITGSSEATILARVVGPTLGGLGVGGTMPDPQVRLVSQGSELIANNDWGDFPDQSGLETVRAAVGAFPLDPGSADAALTASVAAGPYSLPTTGVLDSNGVVLVELYDGGTPGPDQPRLVNLSARATVGTGTNLLIPGFVIEGDVAKTVLIRAVGPTLGGFGVQGVLEDPTMRLFQGTEELASNDDWGSGGQVDVIGATAVTVGAFDLDPSSKDSGLLITLNPGAYTVKVSGVNSTTGVCLVEVYEVPPQ